MASYYYHYCKLYFYFYHDRFPHIKNIYLGFYWLAMANCALNPIVSSFYSKQALLSEISKLNFQIYYWMGNRFRKYFNQLLYWECCKHLYCCIDDDLAENFVQDDDRPRQDSFPLTTIITSAKSPSLLSRKSHSFYLRNKMPQFVRKFLCEHG